MDVFSWRNVHPKGVFYWKNAPAPRQRLRGRPLPLEEQIRVDLRPRRRHRALDTLRLPRLQRRLPRSQLPPPPRRHRLPLGQGRRAPQPPAPNVEVSEESVEKAVVMARAWIDSALLLARDIAIERDRKAFLQVMSLWVVSFVGGFFNFFTVVYIGIVLLFTVPALYDKYQDHVDDKLDVVLMLFSSHYDRIVSRTAEQATKGKKTR